MQKKIFAKAFLFALLAALLLTVGCAEEQETSVSASDAASSAESAVSSQAAISLPDETSSEESGDASSEVIDLPLAPVFTLQGDLRFCPAEGWEQTDEHLYASHDGMLLVRAEVLALPDPKGVTEDLLVSDAVQTLPDALAQTGAEIVTLEAVDVTFLGKEHPSVSLVTAKDGVCVYQQQLYLQDGGQVLLLTVTSKTKDQRELLLSYFQ